MSKRDGDDFELYEVHETPYDPEPAVQEPEGPGRRRVVAAVAGLVAVVAAWYVFAGGRETQERPAGAAGTSTGSAAPPPAVAAPVPSAARPTSTAPKATSATSTEADDPFAPAAIGAAARRAVTAYGSSKGKSAEQWRAGLLEHLTEDGQQTFRLQPPPPPLTVRAVTLSGAAQHGAVAIVQTTGPRLKVVMLWDGEAWLADTIAPTETPAAGPTY